MSKGFSLIEVVAVIAILAIIAAIALPRLTRRRIPVRQQLSRELNNLSRMTQLNAIMTGKLHRIFFDIKNERIQVEIESDKRDSLGRAQFQPLTIPYVKTSAPLHKNIEIERFLVKGKNIIQRGEGLQYTGAWFYIVPEGLAQEVSIDFKDQDTQKMFTLTINPFTAVFSAS